MASNKGQHGADDDAIEPHPLSTWHETPYILAALWGWASLSLTASLCGSEVNGAKFAVHSSLLAIWLARLAVARLRRERNRVWVLYIVTAVFALPIWLGVEAIIEIC